MKISKYLKPENMISILLSTVILGTLGWIANKVYEINGQVSAMSSTLNETADRVDRIAKALPDMRINIASEQINSTFELAVIVNKPTLMSANKWQSIVHFLDFRKPLRTTYKVTLRSPGDVTQLYAISGSAQSNNQNLITFTQYTNWSMEINQPISAPYFISPGDSFVINVYSQDYATWLYDWGAKEMIVISQTPLNPSVNTWPTLVNEIKSNSNDYNVTTTP